MRSLYVNILFTLQFPDAYNCFMMCPQ